MPHLAALLQARLAQLAAEIDARAGQPAAVAIHVVLGDWALTLTAEHYRTLPPPIGGWDGELPSPASLPAAPANLREVERNALEAATNDVTPVSQLALRAGYAPGSYFSAAVTRLVRLGLLVRIGQDGVRRSLP